MSSQLTSEPGDHTSKPMTGPNAVAGNDYDNEKEYRERFGKAHNKSPQDLAFSMFPLGVFLEGTDDANKYEYEAVVRKTDAAHAARRTAKAEQAGTKAAGTAAAVNVNVNNNKHIATNRAIANKLVGFFKDSFNLEIAWNKTNRPHCDPEVMPEGKKSISYPAAPMRVNNKIIFHCQTCLNVHRKFEPLVVGFFRKSNYAWKGVMLDIQQVYYHDYCLSNLAHKAYTDTGISMQPMHTSSIVADTYAAAIDKINSFVPVTKPFFDQDLDAETKKAIIREFKEANLLFPAKDPGTWNVPPGLHIDFGYGDYDFDDRVYMPLPTHSSEYELDKKKHLTALARLGYYLASTYHLVSEFAPFFFDKAAYSKLLYREESNKKKIDDCYVSNQNCHLYLADVSLIMGGNEVRVSGLEPIHQRVHADAIGDQDFKSNRDLDGRFLPAAIIFPLEENKSRSIYINHPARHVVTVSYQQCLLFSGELPHGGMTTRGGQDWRVGIHAYIDSKYHTRKQGTIGLDSSSTLYMPIQHVRLTEHHEVFFEYFNKEVDRLAELADEAFYRREWLHHPPSKQKKGFAKETLAKMVAMGTGQMFEKLKHSEMAEKDYKKMEKKEGSKKQESNKKRKAT